MFKISLLILTIYSKRKHIDIKASAIISPHLSPCQFHYFRKFPPFVVPQDLGPLFFWQLFNRSKSHLKSSGFTGRVAMEVISSNSLVAFSKFLAANKTLAPCFARPKAVSNPIPRLDQCGCEDVEKMIQKLGSQVIPWPSGYNTWHSFSISRRTVSTGLILT